MDYRDYYRQSTYAPPTSRLSGPPQYYNQYTQPSSMVGTGNGQTVSPRTSGATIDPGYGAGYGGPISGVITRPPMPYWGNSALQRRRRTSSSGAIGGQPHPYGGMPSSYYGYQHRIPQPFSGGPPIPGYTGF